MARYKYKAIDRAGKVIHGQAEAANNSDLEARIQNMSLDLIRYKAETEKKRLVTFSANKIDRKELITFTYHLEQLLKAGVPIIEALQDLRDSVVHGVFRDVLAGVIESIGSGRTFSQSLSQHQAIFGQVFINMVEVGERTGKLEHVLHDLSDMIKWQDELAAKAKKMAIYPAFVLGVVMMVMGFLMAYLVPQLIPFIKLAGQEIPWYTQMLIATSAFVQEYWYVILGAPILSVILVKLTLKQNNTQNGSA